MSHIGLTDAVRELKCFETQSDDCSSSLMMASDEMSSSSSSSSSLASTTSSRSVPATSSSGSSVSSKTRRCLKTFCRRLKGTCWLTQSANRSRDVDDEGESPVMMTTAQREEDNGKRRHQHKLGRVLRAHDLVLLGVGMIVGAGIFAMPGKAVIETGPSLSLAFAVAAAAVGVVAFSYAELAAAIPTSGAAYAFTYVYVRTCLLYTSPSPRDRG